MTAATIASAESRTDAWKVQAEIELFQLHFSRWRVANAAAVGLTIVTGITFHYLTGSKALWWWTILVVGTYVHKAIWNLYYEYARLGFARWLQLSTWLKGMCGLASGSLVFFIPADQKGLIIAAVMISGAFSLGEAAACGNLRLIYTTVLPQALITCIALIIYANAPLGVLLCVLYTGMVLHYGRTLLVSMAGALAQRLHAEDLATQLARGQQQLLEAQHQQSVLQERQRVMQDMHDGLGSALSSSLVLLERGELTVSQAAIVMRECIDDLRLVVDSLEPTSKDLPTLLGMLRYRLQHRIEAAGVKLRWQMVDLPTLPWLEPSLALDLLRLMQEAINNVLKHAYATELAIGAIDTGDNIELMLRDNGQGFDPENAAGTGRGIRTMRMRADRLGAQLDISSPSGNGTTIQLRLPKIAPH
jgi:signal transduction histidine kinase